MTQAPTRDPDVAPPDTADADPLHHALCVCQNPPDRTTNQAACGATGRAEPLRRTDPPPLLSRCIVCVDMARQHFAARWLPLRKDPE